MERTGRKNGRSGMKNGKNGVKMEDLDFFYKITFYSKEDIRVKLRVVEIYFNNLKICYNSHLRHYLA